MPTNGILEKYLEQKLIFIKFTSEKYHNNFFSTSNRDWEFEGGKMLKIILSVWSDNTTYTWVLRLSVWLNVSVLGCVNKKVVKSEGTHFLITDVQYPHSYFVLRCVEKIGSISKLRAVSCKQFRINPLPINTNLHHYASTLSFHTKIRKASCILYVT